MALSLRRTPSIWRIRSLSTILMVFALMLQPMYGLAAGQVASAAPYTDYTNTGFDSLSWAVDRKAPVSHSIGDSFSMTIDPSIAGASDYSKQEGFNANIDASTTSIKADLFIDPAWEGKTVSTSLWGGTTPVAAWPRVEFTNKNGFPEITSMRSLGGEPIYNGSVPVAYGSTVPVEVAIDPVAKDFVFYANETEFYRYGKSVYHPSWAQYYDIYFTTFDKVFVKAWNTGVAGDNYTVNWSNLQLGTFVNPAPEVTITTPAQNRFVRTNASDTLRVTGTFTDNRAVNYLQLELVHAGNLAAPVYTMHYSNPGLNADGSFAIDMPVQANLPTGEYNLFYTGTDFDGGVTERMQRVFLIDNTAPETTLVAPTGVVGNTFTVSGVASDNMALNRVYVQLVNRENSQRYGGTTIHLSGEEQSWQQSYNATELDLPDGKYAAHVSVVDHVGNATSVGWSSDFTVDKTAPAAPVLSVNNYTSGAVTNNPSMTASWSQPSSDTVSYEYNYWNNTPGNQYKEDSPYPVETTDLSYSGTFNQGEGTQFMRVRAIDAAGNVSDWSNVFEVVYDTTDPTLSVTSPVNGTLVSNNGRTITVTGTVGDATSGVDRVVMFVNSSNNGTRQVTRDIDEDGNFSFVIPANQLPEGNNRIVINAYDRANNSTTQRIDIMVDNTAPAQPEITDGIGNNTDTTRTITGTAEPGAIVVVTVGDLMREDQADENGLWSVTFTGLARTTHQVSVVATDAAGNSSPVRSASFTVDQLADPNRTTLQTPAPAGGEPAGPGALPITPIVEIFGNSPVLGGDVLGMQNQADTDSEPVADSDNDGVLGDQDQNGTPLTDTAAFGTDSNWLGMAWYWWLAIVAALAGGWLLVAAAIRRNREEEA